MTPSEFEARIVEWARRQSDIVALVQIGSRAQGEGVADIWSDWDFHLITTQPKKYHCSDWVAQIAAPWCAHIERSRRGVFKVSAVFEGGLEVDFVLLAAWQMKLVYWGMRHPDWESWMPARLRRGIQETRVILLNSGHKVLVGGDGWIARISALRIPWPSSRMTFEDFQNHTAAFWQKAVWVAKKIARPEPRSAIHWLHKLIVEHTYSILEEEAWIAGRNARPEALKAEKWLDPKRLQQTEIATSLDRAGLATALLRQIDLFEQASQSVAESRGFGKSDYSKVSQWLRSELAKMTAN